MGIIGSRARPLGAIGAVLLVPLLGAGGPDPAAALGARLLVAERAAVADDRLETVEVALAPGLDAARRGAAAVVAGERAPGPELVDAADRLRGAVPDAASARRAMAALDGARRTLDAGSAPLALDLAPGEVTSIADQLAATADAADAFAAMRRLAESVPGHLDAALAALEAGDVVAAEVRTEAARAAHHVVAGWDVELPTLPVWVDTTGALIEATQALVSATGEGDAAAAERAAAEVTGLAPEADEADRALRIALAEGGAAVTAAPLGRLVEVLRAVGQARAAVASILQAVGR